MIKKKKLFKMKYSYNYCCKGVKAPYIGVL